MAKTFNPLSGDLLKKLKKGGEDTLLGNLFKSLTSPEIQAAIEATAEKQKQYEPPIDISKEAAVKEEERRAKRRQGRKSTLLTSPFGVEGRSPLLKRETLLGV